MLLKPSANFDNPQEILKEVSQKFSELTSFIPVTSTEIEFYLGERKFSFPTIEDECKKQNIAISPITAETGENQYEISLIHSIEKTPSKIADDTESLKKIIADNAKVDFSAKPFPDDMGNGMHIHISLFKNDKNIFVKDDEIFLNAVAGLLETVKIYQNIFIPKKTDYARFQPKIDLGAPTNISWGGNNRTTLIRIPDFHNNPDSKHIEHRLANPETNPHLALAAILSGIHHGIENKLTPPERIYGNAFDEQYDLQKL